MLSNRAFERHCTPAPMASRTLRPMGIPASDILEKSQALLPDTVALRRRIHRNPERGLVLPQTQSAVLESLEGLPAFTGLKALRLSSNQIRNLVELNRISTLETLYLDNNKIIDPVPLYKLPALRHVDLSGNPALQCPRPGSFAQVATVILPQHCR